MSPNGVAHPRSYEPLGDWSRWAACRDTDPDWWFPGRGESTREQKLICSTCPCRKGCLEYALANGEKWGIWGGMSERQRRREMQRRRAVALRRRVA